VDPIIPTPHPNEILGVRGAVETQKRGDVLHTAAMAAEMQSVPVAYATSQPASVPVAYATPIQPAGVVPVVQAIPTAVPGAPVAYPAGAPVAYGTGMRPGDQPRAPFVSGLGRQGSFQRLRTQFNARPAWQRWASGAICALFVVCGIFMFVRTVIMGCGCPDGYSYGSGDSTSCHCSGDVFSCRWSCGNDVCFENNERKSCSSGATAASGRVLCPGMSSGDYCDCTGDCGGSFCTCEAARNVTCCNNGR
jgi:hypothetical protein